MKLNEALQECTLALLRRIAESHSIPLRDDLLRAELSILISQRISDETYLAGYAHRLTAEEKRLLGYLSSNGWQGKAFLLERQFSGQSSNAPGVSACLSLLQRGLLFRTFGVVDGWRGELYHVPEELRVPLESAAPHETAAPSVAVSPVSTPAIVDMRNMPYDLFCLFSYLRRGDRRHNQGSLSKVDVSRVEQERTGQPTRDPLEADRRWRFLSRLCLAGGWIWRDGPFLRPGRSAAKLLAEPPSVIQQRLLDRYLKERAVSDLAETGKLRLPVGSRQIDEPSSRQMLLHHLRQLAGESWVREDAFVAALRQLNPDFLREDYASLGSAVIDAVAEVDLHGPDSWPLVEGEWARYVLRGPLYWLGAVRWGRSSLGERIAFQVASQAPNMPVSSHGYVVRSDFTVSASPDGDLGAMYRLEPYLVLKEATAGERRYRITEASVQHGIDQGGSAVEMLGLLSNSSGEIGAPPAVLDQARKWAMSYGSLRLEGSVLLTCRSEDDLLDVSALPGVGSCLGDRAGPISFRVLPNRFHQLVAALRDAGRPPMVDPSAGSIRARAITGDLSLVKECLFALLVVRALYGQLEIESGEATQDSLEAVLGPEATEEVSKRAQDAVRRIRSLSESGW